MPPKSCARPTDQAPWIGLFVPNSPLPRRLVPREIEAQTLEGRILAWNPLATKMYGWSEPEALTMNICDLIPENLQENTLAALQKLSQTDRLEPYPTRRIAKDGRVVAVRVTATTLVNIGGQIYAIATTKRAEALPSGASPSPL